MTSTQSASAPAAAEGAKPASAWPRRVSFWLVVLGTWLALRYVAQAGFFPNGGHWPPVLSNPADGVASLLVFSGLVLLITLLTSRALPSRLFPGHAQVIAICIGIACWLWPAGTIEDWLARANPVPGPATSSAYVPLLFEHLIVLLLAFLMMWIGGVLKPATLVDAPPGAAPKRAKIIDNPAHLRDLGLGVIVILIALILLSGPRIGQALRGQTYFAVAVGSILATLATYQLSRSLNPIWYWPAPLLAGLIGIVVAVFRPALPPPYDQLNIIPAWAPVRPLPLEWLAVGVPSSLWMLRSIARSQHRAA